MNKQKNISRILICNRGDSGLRVLRACKELGIFAVVAHSSADAESLHVKLADASICIGGGHASDSYLNMNSIIAAATYTDCDAIHPGTGFLAENHEFARRVVEHGLIFIGPKPEYIEMMSNKLTAKMAMESVGVPTIPGSCVLESVEEGVKCANEIGYPVIIKASHGGGGKGMRIARNDDEIKSQLALAQQESKNAFGSADCYLEKYLSNTKHIELQVIADEEKCLHLGARDCSVQRKHQKIIEEAGHEYMKSIVDDEFLNSITAKISKLGYTNLGTVEFVCSDDGLFFLEMNTRLQVEHTVTEEITGVDIVREQIKIANGTNLNFSQKDVKFNGHAIECRINAEDVDNEFAPSVGTITRLHLAAGPGIRVDANIYQGYEIPPYYDNMIAKIIAYDKDRESAIKRMNRALEECFIDNIKTNTNMNKMIINSNDFKKGIVYTSWLEKFIKN